MDETQRDAWAKAEAQTHLRYLRKCHNEAEQIEYLSAALKVAESKGCIRGSTECAQALGVKLNRAS